MSNSILYRINYKSNRYSYKTIRQIHSYIKYERLHETTVTLYRDMISDNISENKRTKFIQNNLPYIHSPFFTNNVECSSQIDECEGYVGFITLFRLSESEIDYVKAQFLRDEHVLLAYSSLTANGIHIIYRFDLYSKEKYIRCLCPSEHRERIGAYINNHVVKYYQKKIQLGIIADEAPCIGMYLSDDKDAIYNESATPFSFIIDRDFESISEYDIPSGNKGIKPKKSVYCLGCRRKKILFETEEEAIRFMQYNNQTISDNSGKSPVRIYFCKFCAGYHLTSIDSWDDNYDLADQIIEDYKKDRANSKERYNREKEKEEKEIIRQFGYCELEERELLTAEEHLDEVKKMYDRLKEAKSIKGINQSSLYYIEFVKSYEDGLCKRLVDYAVFLETELGKGNVTFSFHQLCKDFETLSIKKIKPSFLREEVMKHRSILNDMVKKIVPSEEEIFKQKVPKKIEALKRKVSSLEAYIKLSQYIVAIDLINEYTNDCVKLYNAGADTKELEPIVNKLYNLREKMKELLEPK